MEAEKRINNEAVPLQQAKPARPAPRPEGMQTMGPTLYGQIRRVLVELKLVSEN